MPAFEPLAGWASKFLTVHLSHFPANCGELGPALRSLIRWAMSDIEHPPSYHLGMLGAEWCGSPIIIQYHSNY